MPPLVRPEERQPPDVVASCRSQNVNSPSVVCGRSVARPLSDVAPLDGFAGGPVLVGPRPWSPGTVAGFGLNPGHGRVDDARVDAPLPADVGVLIRTMADANLLWSTTARGVK